MENIKIIYYLIPVLILVSISFLYSFFDRNIKIDLKDFSKSIYDYNLISIDGDSISMSEYKGKKILIVNVASWWGHTPQYAGLQTLYEKYKNDLVVLGFPANNFLQEPGKNQKIKSFCSTKYGVTFPMFEKTNVKKGDNQNPLYIWLSNKELNGWNDKSPSWNFCKYLIDENGNLIKMFSPQIEPLDNEIVQYLNK